MDANTIAHIYFPVHQLWCLLLNISCLSNGQSMLLWEGRPPSQSRTFVHPKDRRKTAASWKITVQLIGLPWEGVRCLQVPGMPAELLILWSWSFIFLDWFFKAFWMLFLNCFSMDATAQVKREMFNAVTSTPSSSSVKQERILCGLCGGCWMRPNNGVKY